MGISSALWRLSRLSWVSRSARRWPGLCVTWWMPAEKAPFQAARGSCHALFCGGNLLAPPLPCTTLPCSTRLTGCRAVPPRQPPSHYSSPRQDEQQLCFVFPASKSAQSACSCAAPITSSHPHSKKNEGKRFSHLASGSLPCSELQTH